MNKFNLKVRIWVIVLALVSPISHFITSTIWNGGNGVITNSAIILLTIPLAGLILGLISKSGTRIRNLLYFLLASYLFMSIDALFLALIYNYHNFGEDFGVGLGMYTIGTAVSALPGFYIRSTFLYFKKRYNKKHQT